MKIALFEILPENLTKFYLNSSAVVNSRLRFAPPDKFFRIFLPHFSKNRFFRKIQLFSENGHFKCKYSVNRLFSQHYIFYTLSIGSRSEKILPNFDILCVLLGNMMPIIFTRPPPVSCLLGILLVYVYVLKASLTMRLRRCSATTSPDQSRSSHSLRDPLLKRHPLSQSPSCSSTPQSS